MCEREREKERREDKEWVSRVVDWGIIFIFTWTRIKVFFVYADVFVKVVLQFVKTRFLLNKSKYFTSYHMSCFGLIKKIEMFPSLSESFIY